MNYFKNTLVVLGLLFSVTIGFSQDADVDQDDAVDDAQDQGSNIQSLTPSKLIGEGKFDIKFFNNIFTQTKFADDNGDIIRDLDRQTFFTSTIDVFVGTSASKRVNLGLILEFRSNTVADRGLFDFLSFDGETGTARSGFTSIAPSIKFVPFKSVGNFSIQSSLFIPLVDQETEDRIVDANGNVIQEGIFLDQNGFIWQNRFFYDVDLGGGGEWQLFTELGTEYNFGSDAEFDSNGNTVEGSFANNSLRLNPGLFLSYFPSSTFTVLALVQHSQLIDLGNDFDQNFTAIGGGVKFQLSKPLNLEFLYTNFVRGNSNGLGQTFNVGLRGVF